MSALYDRIARMIVERDGSDAAEKESAEMFSREVVDTISKEIKQNGFPSIDLVQCHDEAAKPTLGEVALLKAEGRA